MNKYSIATENQAVLSLHQNRTARPIPVNFSEFSHPGRLPKTHFHDPGMYRNIYGRTSGIQDPPNPSPVSLHLLLLLGFAEHIRTIMSSVSSYHHRVVLTHSQRALL
jgi:hypothetical protein